MSTGGGAVVAFLIRKRAKRAMVASQSTRSWRGSPRFPRLRSGQLLAARDDNQAEPLPAKPIKTAGLKSSGRGRIVPTVALGARAERMGAFASRAFPPLFPRPSVCGLRNRTCAVQKSFAVEKAKEIGMENKPAQNIQDTFLNTARKERLNITIYLLSGVKLTGRIRSFDKYSVVLETNNQEQLIFKHAISTVAMGRTIHGHSDKPTVMPSSASVAESSPVPSASGTEG